MATQNEHQLSEQPATRRAVLRLAGQQALVQPHRQEALRRIRAIWRALLLPPELVVGLTFINDLEMRALNRTYRGKNATTDVLSFAHHESEALPGAEHEWGDVLISIDTATRQARQLGHSVADEIGVLWAHALCHLAGLDHERSEKEAARQKACELTLLAGAGIEPALSLTHRGSKH